MWKTGFLTPHVATNESHLQYGADEQPRLFSTPHGKFRPPFPQVLRVCIDDFIIFSLGFSSHAGHLEMILGFQEGSGRALGTETSYRLSEYSGIGHRVSPASRDNRRQRSGVGCWTSS